MSFRRRRHAVNDAEEEIVPPVMFNADTLLELLKRYRGVSSLFSLFGFGRFGFCFGRFGSFGFGFGRFGSFGRFGLSCFYCPVLGLRPRLAFLALFGRLGGNVAKTELIQEFRRLRRHFHDTVFICRVALAAEGNVGKPFGRF